MIQIHFQMIKELLFWGHPLNVMLFHLAHVIGCVRSPPPAEKEENKDECKEDIEHDDEREHAVRY